MARYHQLIREAIKKRRDLGQTQQAIAEACGVSQSTIHSYLNGYPTADQETILGFARGLHIPIENLLAAAGLLAKESAPAYHAVPNLEPIQRFWLDVMDRFEDSKPPETRETQRQMIFAVLKAAHIPVHDLWTDKLERLRKHLDRLPRDGEQSTN